MKTGRTVDIQRRDATLVDIEKKNIAIREKLREKEDLEVDLAAPGVVNFAY